MKSLSFFTASWSRCTWAARLFTRRQQRCVGAMYVHLVTPRNEVQHTAHTAHSTLVHCDSLSTCCPMHHKCTPTLTFALKWLEPFLSASFRSSMAFCSGSTHDSGTHWTHVIFSVYFMMSRPPYTHTKSQSTHAGRTLAHTTSKSSNVHTTRQSGCLRGCLA